ncbi:unnamed protein product [Ceratitis capitata]|uniref:(Mediterranean fruit fly) hypothetical protein n=1 Tax=Ceratitis capitata TaxID=7213 RepID=A0A811UFG0_CERCA|nr:unnamed protein product [Ceratitis capitata]
MKDKNEKFIVRNFFDVFGRFPDVVAQVYTQKLSPGSVVPDKSQDFARQKLICEVKSQSQFLLNLRRWCETEAVSHTPIAAAAAAAGCKKNR